MHTLRQSQLEELDIVAQKLLKKWLGVLARGFTSAGLFSLALQAVKPVSQVYLEGHLGAYINSNLVVNTDTKEAVEVREGARGRRNQEVQHCIVVHRHLQGDKGMQGLFYSYT